MVKYQVYHNGEWIDVRPDCVPGNVPDDADLLEVAVELDDSDDVYIPDDEDDYSDLVGEDE
jgi:hypothetical protein